MRTIYIECQDSTGTGMVLKDKATGEPVAHVATIHFDTLRADSLWEGRMVFLSTELLKPDAEVPEPLTQVSEHVLFATKPPELPETK